MTIYTKTWRTKHKKVNEAQKNQDKLTSDQAKVLQQEKKYSATIEADQNEINMIIDDQNYYWTTDKKTKKKVKKKRKKPKKLSKEQQAKEDKLIKERDAAKTDRDKLLNSKQYKTAKNKISKAKDKTKSAKDKLKSYEKKRHKKALDRIARQRAQNYKRFMAPHASIHATNSLTGLEVFLFAQSEDESNSSEATTYPIDNDDPVTDHVRRTGKTITITGFLYGQKAGKRLWKGTQDDVSGAGLPKKSARQQYNDLLKWQFEGAELVYKSNYTNDARKHKMNYIYYKHLVMTDLTKTLEHPYSDMMQISMTFQFVYKAKVVTNSNKNKNSKGKKGSKGSNISKKVITIKKGMTYWQLARTYHVSVKQLEKWNKYPAKNLPIGKKIQVSAGSSSTKHKTTKKTTKKK